MATTNTEHRSIWLLMSDLLLFNGKLKYIVYHVFMIRTTYFSMRWLCMPCTKPTGLGLDFCNDAHIAHWNKSAGRRVTPLGHIILSLSRPAFDLTFNCCMISRRSATTSITNVHSLGLTWPGMESMTYPTLSDHVNRHTT